MMVSSQGWIGDYLRLMMIVCTFISCIDSFSVSAFHAGSNTVKCSNHALSSLRMAAIEVAMPALSSTMKEGKIVAWNKQVGDKVEMGDVLMVVESDKADMDVEAFEEGYLAKIITPEGGTQTVGASVALLASSPEEIASISTGDGTTPSVAAASPAGLAGATLDVYNTHISHQK